MKKWYLVAYDVRDGKRLRSVARKLEGYGTRIQYSVFRCRLTDRTLERLRWELSQILDVVDDLMIVELCDRCVHKIRARRTSEAWPEQLNNTVII
jgi:CRISPR-associated protein Cas2